MSTRKPYAVKVQVVFRDGSTSQRNYAVGRKSWEQAVHYAIGDMLVLNSTNSDCGYGVHLHAVDIVSVVTSELTQDQFEDEEAFTLSPA